MKAFLFPGQGCQKEGMGKDLYDNFPQARAIFEQANDILGERFSDTLFSASEELLMDTRYTQPAIFIYQVALALGQSRLLMVVSHTARTSYLGIWLHDVTDRRQRREAKSILLNFILLVFVILRGKVSEKSYYFSLFQIKNVYLHD